VRWIPREGAKVDRVACPWLIRKFVDPDCSFESIVKTYKLTDPALLELAKIVHGADTREPDPVPQAAGLRAIAEGMALTIPDDHEKLAKAFPVYDALYAWCQKATAAR